MTQNRLCAELPAQPLIGRTEYARLVGISDSTTKRWARAGIGPQPIKVGPRTIRYRRDEVETFLAGKWAAA
jgi:predicted DNA-binding transcriptional regulator AlpA